METVNISGLLFSVSYVNVGKCLATQSLQKQINLAEKSTLHQDVRHTATYTKVQSMVQYHEKYTSYLHLFSEQDFIGYKTLF